MSLQIWRRLINRLRGPQVKLRAGDAYWLAWGDGIHDDTANIQQAVDHGCNTLPAGTFKASSIPTSGSLYGAGRDKTRIVP